MVANTGTYLDAPFHRYADGKDLAQLPLESLADLDAIVVRLGDGAGPGDHRASVRGHRGRGAGRCWFETGWDVHWRTERYLTGHPFLTADAAEIPGEPRASTLVGIDSLNIDDIGDPARPVHSTLLGVGDPDRRAPVSDSAACRERDFRFFAVPAKVAGFGSWPVRAFGHVLSSNDRLGLSRRRPSIG